MLLHLSPFFPLLALAALSAPPTPTSSAPTTPHLNITAISAHNNASRLECWTLNTPPFLARAGINYPLSDVDGAFIGVVPPRTGVEQGTLGNAVEVQFTFVLSGLLHVTTPYSGLESDLNEVYMAAGGMLVAADTKDVAAKGHVTTFPGLERTVLAQFPVRGGKAPAYTLLHVGPCTAEDLRGL